MSARWPIRPSCRPTPAMQAERDAVQADQQLRLSPGARYWPTRVVTIDRPTLPDGKIDVRRWLAQLDAHLNEGIVS